MNHGDSTLSRSREGKHFFRDFEGPLEGSLPASIRLNATLNNFRANYALVSVLPGIFNRQTPGPWRA